MRMRFEELRQQASEHVDAEPGLRRNPQGAARLLRQIGDGIDSLVEFGQQRLNRSSRESPGSVIGRRSP